MDYDVREGEQFTIGDGASLRFFVKKKEKNEEETRPRSRPVPSIPGDTDEVRYLPVVVHTLLPTSSLAEHDDYLVLLTSADVVDTPGNYLELETHPPRYRAYQGVGPTPASFTAHVEPGNANGSRWSGDTGHLDARESTFPRTYDSHWSITDAWEKHTDPSSIHCGSTEDI